MTVFLERSGETVDRKRVRRLMGLEAVDRTGPIGTNARNIDIQSDPPGRFRVVVATLRAARPAAGWRPRRAPLLRDHSCRRQNRRLPSGLNERLLFVECINPLAEGSSTAFVEKVSSSFPAARSQSLTSEAPVNDLAKEASRRLSGLNVAPTIGKP